MQRDLSRSSLSLGMFAVLALAGTATVVDQPALAQTGNPCHLLTSAQDIPQGFGAAYNLFSAAKELLLTVDCGSSSNATLTIGNGQKTMYIYRFGYEWVNGDWKQIALSGSQLSGSDWYVGTAKVNLSRSQPQLAEDNFVVAYTCLWENNSWKCGCRDTNCSTNHWQLQAFRQAAPSGGGAIAGSQGDLPPGDWKLLWNDEFNEPAGSPPRSHWFNGPNASGVHRDCYISDEDVYHDGKGSIVLRARFANGKNLCPYLTTNSTGYGQEGKDRWILFGPGERGIYIEWRANVSDFKAFAAWVALWMHTTENLAYDGNPGTGTEIDVMEYTPFFDNKSRAIMNNFNTAVIWGKNSDQRTKPPHGRTSGSTYGVNLEDDAFHTWGLEWYKGRQIFYFDGHKFWENTRGVSPAKSHGIRITVEIKDGNPYNNWGIPVGRLQDNPPERLPAHFLVDYVRVYERQ